MTAYEVSRARTVGLEWCATCERWFHRPAHDCDEWVRPVDWRRLHDGLTD